MSNRKAGPFEKMHDQCVATGRNQERRDVLDYLVRARDYYSAEGRDESIATVDRLHSIVKALALSEVIVGITDGKHREAAK